MPDGIIQGRPSEDNPVLLAALSYRAVGWSCIPLRGKAPPLIPWDEFQQRLPEREEIREWWTRWPSANVGIVTGWLSGLTIVDVDGEEGEQALRSLKIPKTYTVATPRGHSWHLYYHYSPLVRTGAKRMPSVDIRNDGGYVVAPPSTINGVTYTCARDIRIDTIPPALLARLKEEEKPSLAPVSPYYNPQDREWVSHALRGVSESERNATATRLVGYFHNRGLTRPAIEEIMRGWARLCTPPMDENELQLTIQSVLRYPGGPVAEKQRWGVGDGKLYF